jgi:Ca2+/H+ antiporter
VLTVKTDKKIEFRLQTTTRLLDTATVHDEAFHPVATSDRTTTEAETEITTTPDLAIKTIETLASTTRTVDAMILASLVDSTMTSTNLHRALTTAMVAAIGAETETAIAMEMEIGIPTNDLETGVALLRDPGAQTRADSIGL